MKKTHLPFILLIPSHRCLLLPGNPIPLATLIPAISDRAFLQTLKSPSPSNRRPPPPLSSPYLSSLETPPLGISDHPIMISSSKSSCRWRLIIHKRWGPSSIARKRHLASVVVGRHRFAWRRDHFRKALTKRSLVCRIVGLIGVILFVASGLLYMFKYRKHKLNATFRGDNGDPDENNNDENKFQLIVHNPPNPKISLESDCAAIPLLWFTVKMVVWWSVRWWWRIGRVC